MGKINWVQKPLTLARRRSYRLLSILVITATATVCFPVPIPNGVAQQNSKSRAETKHTNPHSIWDAILKPLKRKEPPLASRSNICALTPGLLGERNVIWSDRPLFLWQGRVQRLEVQRRDRITAELTALETQLKTAGATVEAIALQKANYFAQRDLWFDALQEVFCVKNPSAALTRTTL